MRVGCFSIVAMLGLAVGVPVRASVTFNISYSASVQALPQFNQSGPNIQTAVQFVENEFSSLYSDPITVNISIDTMSGGLGMSTSNLGNTTYAALLAALIADQTTANDASFVAALPVTDPIAGSHEWDLTCANAKALNLTPVLGCGGSDGTYQFNSNALYTFDPNNRQVAGEFDFIGVTEHEFSEIMGRIFGLGSAVGFANPIYVPFDLTRFTALGVRSFTNCQTSGVSGVYMSVDGGATNSAGFNAGPSGDCSDFNGSILTDPYNAATNSNQGHLLTTADGQSLDVIGFDSTVPEPATFGLVGAVLAGAGLLRRRISARRHQR